MQPAAGQPGKIEGGRSGSANGVNPRQHGEKVGHGGRVGLDMGRKAQGRERLAEVGHWRHPDRFAVEKGSSSQTGGETLVSQGIVNRGGQEFIAPRERHRHTPGGKTMDVVGRAVEWVDNPTGPAASVARLTGRRLSSRSLGLLSYEAMLWKGFLNNPPDFSLGRIVGLRDEIPRTFLLGAKPAQPVKEHNSSGPGRPLADDKVIGSTVIGGLVGSLSIHAGGAREMGEEQKDRVSYADRAIGANHPTEPSLKGRMTMTHSQPAWTLAGLVAQRANATINLAAAQAGLTIAATGDHLLGIDLGNDPGGQYEPSDHWARGEDLVAIYEPADQRQLRATLMWRWLAAPSPAWELVVSAQTSLLESDSRVAVISDITADNIAWGRSTAGGVVWEPLGTGSPCPLAADCLLVQRSGDAVVVAVHPADARRIELVGAGERLRIACWLFSEAIEKGVLLRSRVRAAVGPHQDTAWASATVAALAAAPPLLTT